MTTAAVYPDLRGAPVFISGGASGIGAALVSGFAAQGALVSFADLSPAQEFCTEVEDQTGVRPLSLVCDVTDTSALRECLFEAAARHGPTRVLVSNAANDNRQATLDYSESDWDAAIAVNLKHYMFAAQTVIPGMQKAGHGTIINMSSITYMLGFAGMSAYTASNGAITALTRSLAREFGPDGIRVNAVAPGMVLTARQLEKWLTPEGMESHLQVQSLRRHLDPDDIVGPVLFLASETSAMMTGQCLVVDGGVVGTG